MGAVAASPDGASARDGFHVRQSHGGIVGPGRPVFAGPRRRGAAAAPAPPCGPQESRRVVTSTAAVRVVTAALLAVIVGACGGSSRTYESDAAQILSESTAGVGGR